MYAYMRMYILYIYIITPLQEEEKEGKMIVCSRKREMCTKRIAHRHLRILSNINCGVRAFEIQTHISIAIDRFTRYHDLKFGYLSQFMNRADGRWER